MESTTVLDLIWLVPALPALGAVILLPLGKRIGEPRAGWLATALMFASFLVSIVMAVAFAGLPAGAEHRHTVAIFDWFASGGLRVSMGFLADPISMAGGFNQWKQQGLPTA